MAPSRNAEDADQAIVQTPYGRGLVIRSRPDGIKETQLLEWGEDDHPSSPGSRRRRPKRSPNMLYSSTPFPSVPVMVGDDVTCRFGRGVVKNIDRVRGTKKPKYTIELKSWRLSGRSSVICYVTECSVVRKHTLSEMDVFEKVELAQSQKAKATGYFSTKDFDKALMTYATAVDAVRNIQHDSTSTNEVRADLVLAMITCSNNAGTCCVKLQKYEEAAKFAQNALVLIDALYNKRRKKIHTILNKEGTLDAKLFGEWRAKSYMIMARSRICQGRVKDAVDILKKAKLVVTKYIDEITTKNGKSNALVKASLKSLTVQAKEIRRLLTECAEKKKAHKKMVSH